MRGSPQFEKIAMRGRCRQCGLQTENFNERFCGPGCRMRWKSRFNGSDQIPIKRDPPAHYIPPPTKDNLRAAIFGLLVRDGALCARCGLILDFRPSVGVTAATVVPVGGKLAHFQCSLRREQISDEVREKCKAALIKNIPEFCLSDAQEWFDLNVRQILPKPAAVDEYEAAYRARLAKSQDLFYRCFQGGLMSPR